MNCFTPSGVFEGQTVLVRFTPYTLYYKIRSELPDLKHAKSWIFFSLGETFIGIGMGLGMGEISSNTFGNTAHLLYQKISYGFHA